jgi:hypothetical protein
MMSLKIDWEKLRWVQRELAEYGGLTDEAEVIFLMILKNGKSKKTTIKFGEFLNFFWILSENKELNILTLVVQDDEGRVLYRHKQRNKCDEEIPIGGNTNVVQHWAALTSGEKETYLQMLIAQIQSYER